MNGAEVPGEGSEAPDAATAPAADAAGAADAAQGVSNVSEGVVGDPVDVAPPEGPAVPTDPLDVEALVLTLETVTNERDSYLELSQRTAADMKNLRARSEKERADVVARAAESLVEKLLPVLDAIDGAQVLAGEEPNAIGTQLLSILTQEGLVRLDPTGEPFDPNQHEAVMHEPADGETDGPIVVEVLRVGYAWRDRVLRPAMVKAQG